MLSVSFDVPRLYTLTIKGTTTRNLAIQTTKSAILGQGFGDA
jgi:hypothetical protein